MSVGMMITNNACIHNCCRSTAEYGECQPCLLSPRAILYDRPIRIEHVEWAHRQDDPYESAVDGQS